MSGRRVRRQTFSASGPSQEGMCMFCTLSETTRDLHTSLEVQQQIFLE